PDVLALRRARELGREDGGSPRDERRSDDPRYLEVTRALREALEAMPERRRNSRLSGTLWTELGSALARMWPEFAQEAVHAHEQALKADPDNPSFLYGFALAHKYAGRFAAGVELNRRAARLRKSEAALWNLGICATGAGDDDAAIEAWTALGM